MQLLQRGTRLDPKLIDQDAARLLIGLEGLSLPPRPVESAHELAPQPFAERAVSNERFDLADELRGVSQLELGLEQIFDRGEPALLEPPDLALRKGFVRELGERRPAPQPKRALEKLPALLGAGGLCRASSASKRCTSTCERSTASM